MTSGAPAVSILRQGSYLVASIHNALDDAQMISFADDLISQIGDYRARGVIIDVAALDVIDSFGANTLSRIAEMARLRGAATVIVGIQPAIALAMVTLGMQLESLTCALDLEEGVEHLNRLTSTR
ncbi:STAS domain-containing protein [Ammonicoccus fulvus]|uniref:STAS domain-containing protein n=1 Tax=Ammonicoccus fulvus TaxID=3138240 RepID=A0ABZ3FQZ0_9ACTN